MNAAVLAVAEQMLLDKVLSNKAPVTGESKLKLALATFSGLMAVAAIGFGLYAFYLWLSYNFESVYVMAYMALTTISISILGFATIWGILKYKRFRINKMKEDIKKEIIEFAETTLDLLEEEMTSPIRNNPKVSMLISSTAGYLAGDRFF